MPSESEDSNCIRLLPTIWDTYSEIIFIYKIFLELTWTEGGKTPVVMIFIVLSVNFQQE